MCVYLSDSKGSRWRADVPTAAGKAAGTADVVGLAAAPAAEAPVPRKRLPQMELASQCPASRNNGDELYCIVRACG